MTAECIVAVYGEFVYYATNSAGCSRVGCANKHDTSTYGVSAPTFAWERESLARTPPCKDETSDYLTNNPLGRSHFYGSRPLF